jgi:hypothetical protein
MPTRTIWPLLSKNVGLIFKAHFLIAVREFKTFVQAFRNYIARTEKDPLIHRKVVNVVNGLTDGLKATRNQVPGEVLAEVDRLECLLFAGYDPFFEATSRPGVTFP